MQTFAVFFPDIKYDRKRFILNRPLELTLEEVDGGWTCDEKILTLSSFGHTSVKAVCSVFEDFAVLWDEIAQSPDDELSPEAQRTKLAMLSLVKSIEQR